MITAAIAFVTSTVGRYIIVGLIALAAVGGIYWKGHSDGASRVQAKWDKAVEAAVSRAERARSDAESDPRGLSNNELNRD